MSANSDKFLKDLRQAGSELQAEAKKSNPLYLWYAIAALALLVIILVSCNSKDKPAVPSNAAAQQYPQPIGYSNPAPAPIIVNNGSDGNAALHMATGAMVGAALANNNNRYDDRRYEDRYSKQPVEVKKTTVINKYYNAPAPVTPITTVPAPAPAPKMFPNITSVPKQSSGVSLTKPEAPKYTNTWATKPATTTSGYKPSTSYKSYSLKTTSSTSSSKTKK